MVRILLFATFIGSLSLSCNSTNENKEEEVTLEQTNNEEMTEDMEGMEFATLANGCFWCTEAIFQNLKGVHKVTPGYSGGFIKNPAYKEVKTGSTGHAEVVQIVFDPKEISYNKIIEVFFETHDPTTLNRQGNDVGTQYRSEIFYHNDEQKRVAELAIEAGNESGMWENPIVTKVTAFDTFYEAEDYHQNYYNRVGDENSYCTYVITPKIEKFKKKFYELLKK